MVYRDWKTANLVWAKYMNHFVIIDFGLCQLKDVLEEAFVAVMTTGEC
jgi:hypothetical protein